ncbi:molybdopterin biosynthesis protein MoeD [Candidatus Pelagibacter ubique]|jgi:molybdopterin synthase sulfur carrier subunit|nr:molybdopterin biosynthesis protein MoeD [bacterium]MDB3968321.1 molybdopterin biosynthesis protein MoeD [Candidatus Pelagibacter ubique]MDB4011654.1 molybdopterin biosynthesis protein MoeD [Candidatus Pelagibacter sp.]MDB4141770.1 molybdopterin biosynthesis protein MoeD [Candidatus Pelagibacter sp.]MDB9746323.1 molybdopterin biosynthesis protein MoeD [Candidatus Pelagibacter sp.]
MKIKLELFGASRDFSNKDYLEFDIKQKIEIKDFRKEIIYYLENNFKGNESFVKIVKNSVFCSEDNNIVNDSFKIIKDQKIAIIPPIGGG